MKKSLRGLLLLMMLLLPTTAAAEELKLPAIPVEIEERHRANGGVYYQIKYDLIVNSDDRERYFQNFASIHYHGSNETKQLFESRKDVIKVDGLRTLQITTDKIRIQNKDILVLSFGGYPKLKLTIKNPMNVKDRIYWDFDWEILDKEGEPIKNPEELAKDKVLAQIQSLDKLREKDREKLLAELESKKEYRDVYAVYEKAVIRSGASQEMLELFDLLEGKERLLTETEIASLEKEIVISTSSSLVKRTEGKILTAANKTIPNLVLKIEEPKTGEALPTAATITPEEISTCELTWSVEGKTYQGEAKENTAYTAQCRIKLAEGKRLIPGKSKITVNDQEAKVEPGGKDGEYLVTYTFSNTAVLKKTYHIIWDPNEGSGSMDEVTTEEQEWKLPACTITPPEGKVFDAWLVDGTPYSVGDIVKLTEGTTTIKAQWKDQPPVPDTDAPTDSDAEAPRVPEYRAPQAQTVRMRASDGSGTFVEGPAEALRNVHELVVERRSPSRRDLSLRDLSGREVYSDRLMLVTVPVESFGTENLRLLVDGVYTSFSVSEDGKSVTFPAYFTKDGKRPVEDLLLASDDIEVHGNRSVLPEEGCRFVIEKKSAAKFEVNLVNARGETVHTTGPVWISFPAPDGNATYWGVKIDGCETTFEVENGRVRVAELI